MNHPDDEVVLSARTAKLLMTSVWIVMVLSGQSNPKANNVLEQSVREGFFIALSEVPKLRSKFLEIGKKYRSF